MSIEENQGIMRVFVAGGTGAMGRRLVARGHQVTTTDSGAHAVVGDLATAAGPGQVVRSVLDRHGDIDVLVNNVGGGDASDLRAFFDYDDDLWHKTFGLNLFAAVRTCRAAMPSVIRRRGLVVNVSSLGARMPHTGPVRYTTAKAALTAFSKALAEEYAEQGVRVVTVTPGPTRTSLWTDPNGLGGAMAAAHGIPHADLLATLAASAGIRSGSSSNPTKSRRWSPTWHPQAPPASPGRTTSSTAARSRPRELPRGCARVRFRLPAHA